MKTHLISTSTNNILCKSHQHNGNSVSIEEYLYWKENIGEEKTNTNYNLCTRCLSNLKRKHIKK